MPDTAAFLALKTAENEESCPQDIDWKELISDILTEVMLKMANGQYPPIVSKETTNRNMNTLINEMTSYLMQCYARSHQEEKDQKVCLFLSHLCHTSCEDALKEKKISEQTTGQALF